MFRSALYRRWTVLLLALGTSAGALAAAAASTAAPHQARLVATYRIGFEGPLSGPNAAFGIGERRGAALAVAKANATGNLPFDLKLEAVDDQGDPARSPAAATELINDPEVKAVVGPSFSGSIVATGAFYQNAHLGFVTPSATLASLAHHGWRVFHRIVPSDPTEGVFAADWLKRRGTHRMFVVQDRSSYGKGLGDAVTHEARAKSINVTYLARDGVTTTNYAPLAQRITSSGVHTVYYAGYDVNAALLAKALVHAGYTGVRISGNGVFDSLFTRRAGAAGNGYYATCGCMTKYSSPAQRAFAHAYRAKYHTAPPKLAAEAYDATNAVIRAIRSAVAAGHTSRVAVNAVLGSVNFAGVSTRVAFARDGDIARSAARVNLFQVRHQSFAELGDIRGLPR